VKVTFLRERYSFALKHQGQVCVEYTITVFSVMNSSFIYLVLYSVYYISLDYAPISKNVILIKW
jgi:hypothetical protein